MSRPSCLVIVVLEDDHHEMLVRRYLKKRGIRGKHEIRIEVSPSGAGSAENWVRKTFVKEISVCRSRHARTKLIVVTDADTGTVQERLRQLDQALKDSGKLALDTDRSKWRGWFQSAVSRPGFVASMDTQWMKKPITKRGTIGAS